MVCNVFDGTFFDYNYLITAFIFMNKSVFCISDHQYIIEH